jgi:hypothetical protein
MYSVLLFIGISENQWLEVGYERHSRLTLANPTYLADWPCALLMVKANAR